MTSDTEQLVCRCLTAAVRQRDRQRSHPLCAVPGLGAAGNGAWHCPPLTATAWLSRPGAAFGDGRGGCRTPVV